jgi:hypothetical protein
MRRRRLRSAPFLFGSTEPLRDTVSCPAPLHRASIDAFKEARAIMPNITMLDIEALRQTKLKPYIDKCLEHRAPDPGFHAMMGHNIDLCEAMFVAWDACFNKGRIPHPLKEVIRVQLSRAASCTY